MARVAIVRDGVVDNVLDADDPSIFESEPWLSHLDGASAVTVLGSQFAGPGFTYDAKRSPKFQPPAVSESGDQRGSQVTVTIHNPAPEDAAASLTRAMRKELGDGSD